MSSESPHPSSEQIEMPRATAWPLVLAVGVTLLAASVVIHWVLAVMGGILFLRGLIGWVGELLPGVGHVHEPLVPAEKRAKPIQAAPGGVEQLRPDQPGYRFRIPEKIRPISAGLRGGIVGGMVMPIPALAYGLLSGNGLWFPVNLLGGMVFPFLETMSLEQLQQFSPTLLVVALIIHAVMSSSIGLVYGVLLPTLPQFPGSQLFFGGLLLPLLWSGICYGLMGTINPPLERFVDWRFFIVSQIVFGIAAAVVVERSEKIYIPPAGGGV